MNIQHNIITIKNTKNIKRKINNIILKIKIDLKYINDNK
jgi:hypothetical protein